MSTTLIITHQKSQVYTNIIQLAVSESESTCSITSYYTGRRPNKHKKRQTFI
jgi:hypothetical protein